MDLSDRMKGYEKIWDFRLPNRMPVIVRVDGKGFHRMSRLWGLKKPFDVVFMELMNSLGMYLCKSIQNCIFGYVQSDEISFLLWYKTLESQPFLGNRIQRMSSIIASTATMYFNTVYKDTMTMFDCRVFVLPKEEVCNYFIWRQQDWIRNSLQMFARSFFSHKELNGKNSEEMHEMLHQKGENWANLSVDIKNGRGIMKENDNWSIDYKTPTFTQDRNYIEKYLEDNEEINSLEKKSNLSTKLSIEEKFISESPNNPTDTFYKLKKY